MEPRPIMRSADALLIADALRLLLRASDYASALNYNEWQFAVPIEELRQGGTQLTELRWLVASGVLAHRREIRRANAKTRSFHWADHLSFDDRSCFVLSERGVSFARHLLSNTNRNQLDEYRPLNNGHGNRPSLPAWDRKRRELSLDGTIVKQFLEPARNQETILSTFDDVGWPLQIDDPLSGRCNVEPKKRLRDTVHHLNRRQRNNLIRFHTDGTGQRVWWEIVKSPVRQSLVTGATRLR
jgi:hypothetical protein